MATCTSIARSVQLEFIGVLVRIQTESTVVRLAGQYWQFALPGRTPCCHQYSGVSYAAKTWFQTFLFPERIRQGSIEIRRLDQVRGKS